MQRASAFDFTKALFVLSLCLAAFGYGFAAAEFKIFPGAIVEEAGYWLAAVKHAYTATKPSLMDRSRSTIDDGDFERIAAPTVHNFGGITDTDLILVAGGGGFMQPHSTKDGCLAWLMNRQGDVKHVWNHDEAIWSDLHEVIRFPGKEIYPIGVHLYENGDLLATYHGEDCWPYGVGIAKFDVDSNLLWKRELRNHHWFTVGDDGRIYTSVHRIVDSPYVMGDTNIQLVAKEGKLLSDMILILSPDGEVLEEISLLDVFANSGWIGLFQGATEPDSADRPDERVETTSWDPLHLNDVRLITSKQSQTHPLLKAGDLLLSFRSINAVGILDLNTRRFKWLSAGTTLRQHSPILHDGGVLVFDNRGGSRSSGGSRIVRIDLTTGLPSTVFPRPDVPLPDLFYTFNTGRIDLNPDGRRLLATITNRGALWEIDLESGKVLWEYIYTPPDNPGLRHRISMADYAGQVSFPLNCAGEDR